MLKKCTWKLARAERDVINVVVTIRLDRHQRKLYPGGTGKQQLRLLLV